MKKLSIVVPIFNEEENVRNLYLRLSGVAKKLKYFDDYEIVAVNDGSKDCSLQKLEEIAAQDHHLKVVSFVRNFGQEPATVAGVHQATGDAVAIIDADLQDPPELFLEFEEKLQSGYDIAYGQRSKRLHETFLKKLTSKVFYRTFRWITKIDTPKDTSSFCMMSKRAVADFKSLREQLPFVRGMIFWSGLPKIAIPFVRQKRAAGNTKYNYSKMIKYAMSGVLSFSTTPLYFILYFSAIAGITCSISAITALIIGASSVGWLAIFITFLSSIHLFFLGLLGLYVIKISEKSQQRPCYIIDKVVQKPAESAFNVQNSQTGNRINI